MIEVVGKKHLELEIGSEKTVGEIAGELGIREVNFVFLLNGKPVTADRIVKKEDSLVFMEVFSGGLGSSSHSSALSPCTRARVLGDQNMDLEKNLSTTVNFSELLCGSIISSCPLRSFRCAPILNSGSLDLT